MNSRYVKICNSKYVIEVLCHQDGEINNKV